MDVGGESIDQSLVSCIAVGCLSGAYPPVCTVMQFSVLSGFPKFFKSSSVILHCCNSEGIRGVLAKY